MKFADAHVRLSFITGVSKFRRAFSRGARGACPSHGNASLFSGLSNLRDITLDPRYSTICGYTEADLDAVFAPELPGLDRAAIREWYNGYYWLGEKRVYNPFDVLLLFDSRAFKGHWFETGSLRFLVDVLAERQCARWTSTACAARRNCCRPSTSTRSAPRRCCSKPAT